MRTALITALALCLAAATADAQGTFPLQRKPAEANQTPALRMGTQSCGAQPKPSVGLAGVPAAVADGAPCFFGVPVGEKPHWAVTVPGETPKLLVDTDGDNDFADETPLAGSASGTSIDFGTVTVTLGDSASATLRLMGRARKAGEPPRYLFVMPGVYCTGTVKLAGKTHAVALVDGNRNGRFNDAFAGTYDRRNLDGLGGDLDSSGTFDPVRGLEGPFEVMPLGTRLQVGEAFYTVSVAADGSSITLETVDPGYGTLELGSGVGGLLAYSDYGVYRAGSSDGGAVRLPVGRYAFLRLTLAKTDKAGESWQLNDDRAPESPPAHRDPPGTDAPRPDGPPADRGRGRAAAEPRGVPGPLAQGGRRRDVRPRRDQGAPAPAAARLRGPGRRR